MTRTFALLAVSLGLLVMSGCGEVKGSNAAAAQAQTAALQPMPPAPEDRDLKLSPPPLAPAPLPKIEIAAPSSADNGKQPFDFSDNGQPLAAPTAGQNPASHGQAIIKLSDAKVSRASPGAYRYQIAYEFVQGQASPTKFYTVTLHGLPANRQETSHLAPAAGRSLLPRGTFAGTVGIPGDISGAMILVLEGDRANSDGRLASNVLEVGLDGNPPPGQNNATAAVPPLNNSDAGPPHVQVTDAIIRQVDAGKFHFEFNYAFDRGGPIAADSYAVLIEDTVPGEQPKYPVLMELPGRSLQRSGTLQGNFAWDGKAPSLKICVHRAAKGEAKAYAISDGLMAPVIRDDGASALNGPRIGPTVGRTPSSSGPTRVDVGGEFWRIDANKLRFRVGYDFKSGQLDPKKWYTVVVHEEGANAHGGQATAKFPGSVMFPDGGYLIDDLALGGNAGEYAAQMLEGDSEQDPGHPISALNAGYVIRDLAPSAAVRSLPLADKAGAGPAAAKNSPHAGGAVHVALSNASVARVDAGRVHFKVDYDFTSGQPDPKHVYVVVVTNPDETFHGVIRREKNFVGKGLPSKGTFEGDLGLGGRNPTFQMKIEDLVPPGIVHVVSDVVEIGVHRNIKPDKQHADLRPAAVGVGAQGKDYGAGMVTTPVSAYFAAKQMIVFNIQLPKAMQMFKLTKNRNPNSQAEFDEQIIKEWDIKLPELPAGERYLYDPAKGELMVEHPEKK